MEDQAIDFFQFGATSDIAQRLFTDERDLTSASEFAD